MLNINSTQQGGIYFFTTIDYYSSGLSLMLIAFFEVTAVTWFYGMSTCVTLASLILFIVWTKACMLFIRDCCLGCLFV